MIRDIADLLHAFAEREATALRVAGIKHAPTIGAMYEGLTADILGKTLPPGLDLKVVSGFAVDDSGNISNQIDCMLVRGDATPVPYTDNFKCHIKDVIAALEVKKALFGQELSDAYGQLQEVQLFHSRWIQRVKSGRSVSINPSLRAFAEITGVIAPERENLDALSIELQHIYPLVVAEQFGPIRVALGYEGYKNEATLRKGFLDFVGDKTLQLGYGPPSYPQLIVAGNASLVKFNGHPYRAPMHNGKLLVLASSSANPLLLLLELIWTRLTYIHPMPELFGEDLVIEGVAPLLWGKLKEHPNEPGQYGWEMTFDKISNKELASAPATSDWEPEVLTLQQFVIIDELCRKGSVDTKEPDFISFVTEEERSVEAFVDSLIGTHLVARNGDLLELVTTRCVTAVLPDGRYVAADDNTGRFTRWLDKFMERCEKPASEV